jgi:hypothetical protein
VCLGPLGQNVVFLEHLFLAVIMDGPCILVLQISSPRTFLRGKPWQKSLKYATKGGSGVERPFDLIIAPSAFELCQTKHHPKIEKYRTKIELPGLVRTRYHTHYVMPSTHFV